MLNSQQQACILALNECALACIELTDISSLHSPIELTRCKTLNFDCVEMCRFTAAAIVRESELLESICLLCAESCEMSSAECEKHDCDQCRRCARAGKKCAALCRDLVSLRGSAEQLTLRVTATIEKETA